MFLRKNKIIKFKNSNPKIINNLEYNKIISKIIKLI